MTKQFKDIRTDLVMERKRLTEELTSKVNLAIEGHEGSPFGKREEMASEEFEFKKRLALTQHIREQLSDVEYPLAKLEKGIYGICDSCGKPIPITRLEAIPQANFCLGCKVLQTKNDKTW